MSTGARQIAGPARPGPGGSTAREAIVEYRLGKLVSAGVLHGGWLDYGCADGGYTLGLLDRGAEHVTGVDVGADRVEAARDAHEADPRANFVAVEAETLPFANDSFDGVLLNEVLEHVDNEAATLAEIARVLRPGGHLVLFSPNRWFPLEGHGIEWGENSEFDPPTPFIPWLPDRLTAKVRRARNYWPGQLEELVTQSGLTVTEKSTAFPQFEFYPWLPKTWIPRYRHAIPTLETTPILKWFGVSVFIVAEKR